jgi:carbamoyltransferase
MNILGLGGLLNDPACALLRDGAIVAALEQNKLAGRFEPGELPRQAMTEVLRLAGVAPAGIDTVAIARPFAGRGDSRLHLELRALFPQAHIALVEHHQAHAASAYFASPFDQATILTLDHSGDFRCGARWRAAANEIDLEREIYFPDSLGDLYSRVTALLGFRPHAEEHKVQWLSTFAEPRLVSLFLEILSINGNWPRLDRSWFDADRPGHGGFSDRFYERVGAVEGKQAEIAASLQSAVEQAVIAMAGDGENLCLAGGLGLNALLVAALEASGRWKNVFVQPAAGNAGTALGAAWHAWHVIHNSAARAPLETLALGPGFRPVEIKEVLENCKLRFRFLLTTDELIHTAIDQLAGDRILAWMQGRMEFGPRALGNRSILASPLNPYSTENLNVFIKHREPFRKFAASVPAELASEYFDAGPNARFLATVGRVRPAHRKTFESAVLGRDLVRVHLVDARENPLFHQLLHAWGRQTGLPVLYNTSFNLFGSPLVCTPRDAVRSFYSSGIDAMLVGGFFLDK